MGADEKAKRIVRFASALWHGDRGRLGNVEAYLAEAKQIADALPGLDRDDVIDLLHKSRSVPPGQHPLDPINARRRGFARPRPHPSNPSTGTAGGKARRRVGKGSSTPRKGGKTRHSPKEGQGRGSLPPPPRRSHRPVSASQTPGSVPPSRDDGEGRDQLGSGLFRRRGVREPRRHSNFPRAPVKHIDTCPMALQLHGVAIVSFAGDHKTSRANGGISPNL